jgi:hypothetical protein
MARVPALRRRARSRRLWPPLVALVGLAVLFAAFSGGSHDTPSHGGSTTSTTGQAATTTTTSSTSTSTLPASRTTTSPSTATPGSGTTTTTPGDALVQADNFTTCMRVHGVSGFPEPTVVNGQITFAGPPGLGRTSAFPLAQQTCGQSVYGTAPVQGGGNG